MDANFDDLENYNSLARRELALLEVLARLAGDVIERGQSELFSRYEGAIRDYETRFQATFENAAVGIAHVAPDGRWLRVNKALCRIVGYPAEELVTKSFQDITHPDDLAADLAQVEQIRDGKINSYEMDKRYLRKDGAIVWVRLTVGCVRKSDGSIDYFVSVVEDISARKHAEDELRKSEERFRSSLVHSRLNAAAAQGIGLALHELATNASKYGAFSTDRGRADIGWGTEGDTFTMSWIERDGPSVSAPKRRGFGTIVVEAMAERSVDGTVDLHYPPSGLTWRLTCPAANALEHREPAQISGRKRKSN